MFRKLPLKNIIIVFSAILVVPVMAFAMMMANPSEGLNDKNSNMNITSDETLNDAVSSATSVLTSGALGYFDAATSATGNVQTGKGGSTDAVSSATVNPTAIGSMQSDDDQYEDDDDDEADEGDDDDD